MNIGHLDSGISTVSPLLREKTAKYIAVGRNGRVRMGVKPFDTGTHGTFTAGIIYGDNYPGLPELSENTRLCVVALKSGGKTILSLLKGMDALLGCDIKIAFMPVGIPQQTPVFWGLLEALRKQNILIIAAVGNGGMGKAYAPGMYPQVLSVGAVDEQHRVMRLSGSHYDPEAQYIKPDLMAPGVHTLPASPGSAAKKKSGTSMAAAYVTGVAARLWQCRPEASAETLKHTLLSTAKPLSAGQRHRCGYGMIQPGAALRKLLNREVPDVSFTTAKTPFFLTQAYIDPRFRRQYQKALPGRKLEAVVIAKNADVSKNNSRKLLYRIREKTGIAPEMLYFFNHADMAHIRAERSFYDALLTAPELFVCSAVDIGIFGSGT